MMPLLLTFPADRAMLLKLLEPEIDSMIGAAVTNTRATVWAEARLRLGRSEAMRRAITNVVRASARVDAAKNTRDELPSINALIAAASGLRRALEASTKGL